MSTSSDENDGPTLETLADGTHRVRVRYGKKRSRFRIPTIDPDLALERAAVLIAMGGKLGGVPPELARGLLERAGAADGPELRKLQATVEKLASGLGVRKKEANPRERWTVRELGEAWTDGTLAQEFPDQIRARRGVEKIESRLERHVYPIIGDRPVSAVTLADVERVMVSLSGKRPTQEKLSPLSRRTIALLMNRLFAMAVYPLKLRDSSPIPKGFVPKAGKRKAMAYLYPDEDRTLLACKAIPIRERLLYGFLLREGCRVSEALALRWGDLDLERGAIRLEKNKTDDPRMWALSPGVAAALTPFKGQPHELVFEPPADPLGMAEVLRARLWEAGVRRPELHKATAERIALRVHDLRGSFVTVALANGRSEAWVSDRTGHRSSQMIARYKRAARTAAELSLGDWTPLNVALGIVQPATLPAVEHVDSEVSDAVDGTASGTTWSRLLDLNLRPALYENSGAASASCTTAKTSRETLYSAAGETPVPGLSQLRAELDEAVAAEDWARVAELARALSTST